MIYRLLVLAFLSFSIAACGGSSGGSDDPVGGDTSGNTTDGDTGGRDQW